MFLGGEAARSESCIDCSRMKVGYLIRHDPRRFFVDKL